MCSRDQLGGSSLLIMCGRLGTQKRAAAAGNLCEAKCVSLNRPRGHENFAEPKLYGPIRRSGVRVRWGGVRCAAVG